MYCFSLSIFFFFFLKKQDNPVGVGYSFVEDETLYVKNDEEAARDLTTLLISIFNKDESLQKSLLYIMGES